MTLRDCSGIGEHVLDAAVVGLDADQAEAEVDRGVADQVVDLPVAVLGDGEHRPPRRGGDPGVGQRLLHALLGVLAEDLDEQGAGGVEELAGPRRPKEPAGVEDDDVVADRKSVV